MKLIRSIVLLAILGIQIAFGQTQVTVDSATIKYNKLSAQMGSLSEHGMLTVFVGMDMNFVNEKLQHFLYKYHDLGVIPNDDKIDFSHPIKTIIESYALPISNTIKEHILYVKYYLVADKNKEMIIKSCEIYGYNPFVIDFYTSYWNTTINIEPLKNGQIAYNYLGNDKISIFYKPKTKGLMIKIEANNLHIVNTKKPKHEIEEIRDSSYSTLIYINKKEVPLYKLPNKKAKKLGDLLGPSCASYEGSTGKDWIKVSIMGHEGFVLKKDVVLKKSMLDTVLFGKKYIDDYSDMGAFSSPLK